MSKYVKELMCAELERDLGETTSALILDLKGLDAISEHKLRKDLRQKDIKIRVVRNNLARLVFEKKGMSGLDPFLTGPSVLVWGGSGIAELAKEISDQVKALKKPVIKGGCVDGVAVGPDMVESLTKLPSRETLIAQVLALLMSPTRQVLAQLNAPISGVMSQVKTLAERESGDTPSDQG
ncbi:ribosomal protein L10 [Isosphaera pallida ATCC 43644]|uniref:Large ribosomal subunit protein uL10 n=2 Tax=Isosphaera pallida TaxID=128 RepID=E8R5G3_ISOPI|nr:ribosomal protein L10 [Isosphaera pallida ATCC 43644]